MKTSRNSFLIVALGLVVALGISGCGNKAADEAATQARTPVPSEDTRTSSQ